MIEVLLEVFLRGLAELFLQVFGDVLLQAAIRRFRARGVEPLGPVLAVLGHAALGGVFGGLSLLVFSRPFLETRTLQLVNLLVTPLLAGAVLAAIGSRRAFLGGYAFALALSGVRYLGAT
jgi:hypothetical protein